MPHPLVMQLRFTRSEFKRALRGVTNADARKRIAPMNCISWNVGHLAWQEQRYFLFYAQGKMIFPEINEQFAFGAPASTPPLAEMWRAWNRVTKAADEWLDTVTAEELLEHVVRDGKKNPVHLWFASSTRHLSLLVPHRGKYGDSTAAGTKTFTAIRRRS